MAISYKFLQECNIKIQLRPKDFSKDPEYGQSIRDFHEKRI